MNQEANGHLNRQVSPRAPCGVILLVSQPDALVGFGVTVRQPEVVNVSRQKLRPGATNSWAQPEMGLLSSWHLHGV